MEQKKYWQSFGELNETESYQKSVKDEFREELPFESNNGLLEAVTPRRDFLKYLGFSTAAAAVAASCEVPVKKAIPFTNKPEDITPGVATYYATTYMQGNEVLSVLAKVRDGRPIKIEGNELSPITQGGTSARAQASVLDLYDKARLRFPRIDSREVTFEILDRTIAEKMAALGGKPVALLTGSVSSPSSREVINQFIAKFPGSRHVQYDGVSYTGMLLANQQSFGQYAIPSYDFSKAKVIVSIGADFLGTWISPVEFNRQYAVGRRINEKNPSMSKHYQFESVATLTGSNADEKYLHRPSQTGAVALALLNALNGANPSGMDAKLAAGITKAARDLKAAGGAALVVCGSNDVNIQNIVNAINNSIGAVGNTIDWSSTYNTVKGNDADFVRLMNDMKAGAIGAVIIHGANPAYTWFNSKEFTEALKKVPVRISLNPKLDETAEHCNFLVPDHHYLESWGDAEPKTGYFSFLQPTIYPLFKTRQWQDSLMKWSGATTDYLTFLKTYWSGKLGGQAGWDKALQDGITGSTKGTSPVAVAAGSVIKDSTAAAKTAAPVAAPVATGSRGAAYNSATAATAAAAIKSGNTQGVEVVLYQKVAIADGCNASNPWLQELPDPVTRATWDNYAIISPAMAKSLVDIDLTNGGQSDSYEVNPDKPQVTVTVNGVSLTLPALIIPGTDANTIGIALGYGRSAHVGKAAEGVGKNAYPFSSWNGTSVLYTANAEVKATGDKYPVALTQTHYRYHTEHGTRTEVIKEMSFSAFKADPDQVLQHRRDELKPWGGLEHFEAKGTLYPVFEKPGIQWAMSIDMNTCTGCSACVVACHTENNVPVVGKSEVLRFHDMHWLRIDRYYSGSVDNPEVTFQPMLCQHCNNAPCENVCPVAATNHSSEGANQMIYNRCIGTRYCANNCPYKVRRFNWADYTGSDSFPHNQEGAMGNNEAIMLMNDDLTRMVLNPDVTVRSRGVIEKCSFCVQRTQEGKLKAKKESRPLESGRVDESGKEYWDVKTACQQACPTNAIVFGNLNDRNSAITQLRVQNPNRLYYVLEPIHTMPSVNYLAKVRNSDLMLAENTTGTHVSDSKDEKVQRH